MDARYYLHLIPAVVIAITVHEFAHAWTALKFGDTTALRAGRVTLNPLAHLDPLGTLLLFLAGFGWGKPTPVNTSALRHPRAGLVVSAAGPISNLLVACAAGLVVRTPWIMGGLKTVGADAQVWLLAATIVSINLVLAFFNLLPIWPLDGSHVVEHLLPSSQAMQFKRFGMAYGAFMLLGLILLERLSGFSVIGLLVSPPVKFLSAFFLGT